MIILCPYQVPKTAEEIRAWMDGECDDESFELAKNHPYKLLGLACLLGPFIRKARIDKTPMRVRITLLLGSLAFILVPSLVANMDGNVLIVYILGYIIAGNYRFDPWGGCFCSIYLLTIISPLTVLVPVMFNKFQRVMIADLVFFAIMSLGGLATVIFLLYEAGDYYSAFSPLFVCIPIILYAIIIRAFVKAPLPDLESKDTSLNNIRELDSPLHYEVELHSSR